MTVIDLRLFRDMRMMVTLPPDPAASFFLMPLGPPFFFFLPSTKGCVSVWGLGVASVFCCHIIHEHSPLISQLLTFFVAVSVLFEKENNRGKKGGETDLHQKEDPIRPSKRLTSPPSAAPSSPSAGASALGLAAAAPAPPPPPLFKLSFASISSTVLPCTV